MLRIYIILFINNVYDLLNCFYVGMLYEDLFNSRKCNYWYSVSSFIFRLILEKTWLFTVMRYNNNYNCPIRGAYRLVQATEDDSHEKNWCILSSLCAEWWYISFSDVWLFFTDTLDGCSVGVETTDFATHVYHENSYNYGQYLYNKEKVNLGFAFRRQVCAQNKMIKNACGNNAKIVYPWDYGHFGENAKYFKTLLYGYRDRFSRRWYFLRQTYDIRNFENSWFRWFFQLAGALSGNDASCILTHTAIAPLCPVLELSVAGSAFMRGVSSSGIRTVTLKTRDRMIESLRVLKTCRKTAILLSRMNYANN